MTQPVNISATVQRARHVAQNPKTYTPTTVAMAKGLVALHERFVEATGGAPLPPDAGTPQDG